MSPLYPTHLIKASCLIYGVLICLFVLPACATKKEKKIDGNRVSQTPQLAFWQKGISTITHLIPKKQKPPKALIPQWTGIIRMVNSAEHFVLIEAQVISTAIPGETYVSINQGHETASLRMTSLKNPPFLIADIISGTPSPEEKIYRVQNPAPPILDSSSSPPPQKLKSTRTKNTGPR